MWQNLEGREARGGDGLCQQRYGPRLTKRPIAGFPVGDDAAVRIERIDPDGLHVTPGYHHVTVVQAGRLAFLSGQCPVRPDGTHLPADNLPVQLDQTVANCLGVLAAVGAGPSDVVKSTVYVACDSRRELAQVWDLLVESPLGAAFSTASTLVGVTSLGYPGQRVEIDLTAAIG
jgi:enamine deaminase RidA (YjgF/YER057c/UK114 family)